MINMNFIFLCVCHMGLAVDFESSLLWLYKFGKVDKFKHFLIQFHFFGFPTFSVGVLHTIRVFVGVLWNSIFEQVVSNKLKVNVA